MEMNSLPNGNSTPSTPPVPTTTSPPSSKVGQLAESLRLEHQFLRVPFEHYKKTIRANHRVVEKEMSSVMSGVSDAADRDDLSSDEAVNHLNSLVSRLQGLKRKLEEGSRVEHLQAQRCRARLDHLESADAENLSEWNNMRLKRILVDYMLRMSYYDTAVKLAESSNIQDLVDIDVFQEAKKVIDALQNKEVAPALAWCADNKSRLKKSRVKLIFNVAIELVFFLNIDNGFAVNLSCNTRRLLHHFCLSYLSRIQGTGNGMVWHLVQMKGGIGKGYCTLVGKKPLCLMPCVLGKQNEGILTLSRYGCDTLSNANFFYQWQSKFEFQLRLQEFVELVRAENNLRAITYARKYLAPWGSTHMKELQRVFVTLAYKSTTECATYKVLFEPTQWDHLVDLFKQEFCKLYGMTLEPLLNIYLQAGLSALKTPYCYEDDCTKEDPLSQESFRKLALPLPYSKQHHSKLVCYITKELMDTENPPQVLPNGYVYSTKALEEMAKKNDGKITCPRTGFVCNYKDLVKAYIS
ncbi:hypothetical protein FEM48_Zijuj03G0081100 [Ziziphus jujuba var. spinosa]|uniref:Protein MAEA homolog n=1 Tax=Ziziphus jujuba var. spinosa TaxID=714518 RepID=A0A978VP55_ZIZJJ|nr:hypothetical protein FEM48_Zijuj03G0081100 [Ziziphus jujuba var. spinosa]